MKKLTCQYITEFETADGESKHEKCGKLATHVDEGWGAVCDDHAAMLEAQAIEFAHNDAAVKLETAQRLFDMDDRDPFDAIWTAALAQPEYVRWDCILSKN